MIDTSKFVGLTESDARALAAQAGLSVVVGTSVATFLTNSMQMNRLTLVVASGVVTNARIG